MMRFGNQATVLAHRRYLTTRARYLAATTQSLSFSLRKRTHARYFSSTGDDGEQGDGGDEGNVTADASSTPAAEVGGKRSDSVESIYKLFSEVLEKDRQSSSAEYEAGKTGLGTGFGQRRAGGARLPELRPMVARPRSRRASEVFGKLKAWSDKSRSATRPSGPNDDTWDPSDPKVKMWNNATGGRLDDDEFVEMFTDFDKGYYEDQLGNVKLGATTVENKEAQELMERRFLDAQGRKWQNYNVPYKYFQSVDVPAERPEGDPMSFYDPMSQPASPISPNPDQDLDLDPTSRQDHIAGAEDPLTYKPQLALLRDEAKRLQKHLKRCPFCSDALPGLDFKNTFLLSLFIDVEGNIAPKYKTLLCSKHQRKLNRAIKTSRQMSLMPFDTKLTEYRTQGERRFTPSDDMRRMKDKDYEIRFPVPRTYLQDGEQLELVVEAIQHGDGHRVGSLDEIDDAFEAREEGKSISEDTVPAHGKKYYAPHEAVPDSVLNALSDEQRESITMRLATDDDAPIVDDNLGYYSEDEGADGPPRHFGSMM